MLWYSTPWTAPPFSNDPLWLTLFVEGVNDRLLDHCQVSSVRHYCAFKEQEIPRMYTAWMVIYWISNVNILIFWDIGFLTFISCEVLSSKKKKTFKVFYFTCNESKIYESFTFWNKLQEWTFSPYSNFWDVPVYMCVYIYIYIYICIILFFYFSIVFPPAYEYFMILMRFLFAVTMWSWWPCSLPSAWSITTPWTLTSPCPCTWSSDQWVSFSHGFNNRALLISVTSHFDRRDL